MDELVRWLGVQLDEDERIARACSGNGEWEAEHIAIYGPNLGVEVRAHMAAHDPARVLREINAKRRIVAAYLPPGGDPHPGLPCINYEGQDPADYEGHDACGPQAPAAARRTDGRP